MYPDIVPAWYVWVLSLFLPYIESFIIQKSWASWLKVLTAFAISIVVALGAVYFAGKFDFAHILANIAVIFPIAQIAFDSIWKPSIKARQEDEF